MSSARRVGRRLGYPRQRALVASTQRLRALSFPSKPSLSRGGPPALHPRWKFFGSPRRLFLLLSLSSLALGNLSCRAQEERGPLNILFLLADDQRADAIAAWGNPHIQTPHLDRLAGEGFSFRANYNLGGNSGAVCVPSRAMINSGQAYFRIRNDLQGTPILPEVLRQGGYTTFATGKWHNQEPSWLRGFQRGKNVFFGGMADHTQVPIVDLSPDGDLVNPRTGDKFSSELFADAACEFLESYQDEAPFYAYVAFTAPHDPRQPPLEWREKYYRSPPPLPVNFLPQHPFNLGGWLTVRDEVLAEWPRTREVVGDQLAEYYGMITHLDSQVGRVLKSLENSRHRDDTLVIFAADHGLAMGSHGLLGKQSIYEHSQKCPLIFRGPGVPRGESQALTYLLDIFPTVLSQVGIDPPGPVDGHDLAPLWSKQKQAVRESLFLAFTDQARSVRDERYKLIVYPQLNHSQLFDLQEDPHEMDSLAVQEVQQTRKAQLRRHLQEWQQRLGDSQPLSVADPLPMEIDLTGVEREADRWQPDWIVEKYF